jgi:agmatine/peptidylarginine deiminase
VICVADDDLQIYAESACAPHGVDMDRVRFVTVALRRHLAARFRPGDLAFDGGSRSACSISASPAGAASTWPADDDRLIQALHRTERVRRCARDEIDFALEGGAIDTDGAGTLLTTWRCLHERHPEASREELSDTRSSPAGCARTGCCGSTTAIWRATTPTRISTPSPALPAEDAIVFQACDDPADSHYAELRRWRRDRRALRTREDRPYRLFPLPWAQPVIDDRWRRRLAASYANFLIVNGAVLMPAYGDPADNAAAQRCWPKRSPIARSCPCPAAR